MMSQRKSRMKLKTRRDSATAANRVSTSAESNIGWSTSYQAGSSSANSDADESSTSEDEAMLRGRPAALSQLSASGRRTSVTPSPRGFEFAWHVEPSASHVASETARRRSPHPPDSPTDVLTQQGSHVHRSSSPAPTFMRSKALPPVSSYFSSSPGSSISSLLPDVIIYRVGIPLTHLAWRVTFDARKTGENLLLIFSLILAIIRLFSLDGLSSFGQGITYELCIIVLLTLMHVAFIHVTQIGSERHAKKAAAPVAPLSRPLTAKELYRQQVAAAVPPRQDEFSYIWMTVPKNYRDSADDGSITGLLLGPLLAATMLFEAKLDTQSGTVDERSKWLVEAPLKLGHGKSEIPAFQALMYSRYNLIHLATLCSLILLVHMCASRWADWRYRASPTAEEGEKNWVPRRESLRTRKYIIFTLSTTISALILRLALAEFAPLSPFWKDLSPFEVSAISLFYQFSLYSMVRLAHRGFTIGELGLVALGATVLFMEAVHLTWARLWPDSIAFIGTYRLPTPLLIYQIALIPGSLLTGILLSPILYYSRIIAQTPSRRLRTPQDRLPQLRTLAAGFYLGAAIIVGGVIGLWSRWCLRGRDPWLWAIFWLLEGRRPWSRPLLIAYWGLLGSLSVAGWNRQLARSRTARLRTSNTATAGDPPVVGQRVSSPSNANSPLTSSLSSSITPNVSNVASEYLDAADKHIPTLKVNARRKFFHALTVVMFMPGIAFDPAFTHLAFSAAFALFTFAEYIRYFALYPFGASVHLFMNEFLDSKDSGTAILSHFYLLTGCALPLWIESPTTSRQLTGAIVLGVADAVASIVGKRVGRRRWSPTYPKTIEGSLAFVGSIVLCAWLLRALGLTEPIQSKAYFGAACMSAVLEALSAQNDNLTLPLYMWTMVVLFQPSA